MKKSRPIGFIISNKSKNTSFIVANTNQKHKTEKKVTKKPNMTILSFDSDEYREDVNITSNDANMNVFVLGATGSGKTSSIIHPMASALISQGNSGLIVDVKGNLGPQIRALAKHHGRENDIMEFGNCSGATPVNLLEGMDEQQVSDFAQGLINKKELDTHNDDWHYKGVRYFSSIYVIMKLLSQKDKRLSPSIQSVSSILNSPQKAQKIMAYYLAEGIDPTDESQKEIYQRILADTFNPLNYPNEVGTYSYSEQVTWGSQMMRDLLNEIMSAPGILENFSMHGAANVDFQKLLYEENKIILIRFSPDTSIAGEFISRYLIDKLYTTIRKHGLNFQRTQAKKKEPKYTFMILDEYQSLVNLAKKDKFNDTQFLAQSRELGHINILCSQSISGITTQYSKEAVDSLLSNCRTKISFCTDDPQTIKTMQRFDLEVSRLERGKAAVVWTDSQKGSVQEDILGLQTEHDKISPLLKSARYVQFVPVGNEEKDFLAQQQNASLALIKKLCEVHSDNIENVFEYAKENMYSLDTEEVKKRYYHTPESSSSRHTLKGFRS